VLSGVASLVYKVKQKFPYGKMWMKKAGAIFRVGKWRLPVGSL
jgi:hypothetical protein